MSKKFQKEKEATSPAQLKEVREDSPVKVASDDLYPMQLSWKELENATLKAQMAQMQLEQASKNLEDTKKSLEDAKKKVGELNQGLNTKYGLDVQKDRINIDTGDITRG